MFKSMKTKLAAVAGSSLALAGSSFAAVPADVTTAISSVGTDGATIGGAVLTVIIGIVAFKYLRKAV